jgi:hypothetical protein
MVKKMDKVDGPNTEKSQWIKLEFLMDPDNPSSGSKYSRHISIFKDECPEDWIKWLMVFCEIENLMPMEEPAGKTRMFQTLLKGQALSYGYQAIRSTYHTTLQATPCQLVCGRDMIHNIAFRENWDQVQKRKQGITNNSNQKENKSLIPYEYKVGDQVLLETPGILRKLSTPRTWPYPVTNVYMNGIIRIQKFKEELYQKEWTSVESLHSIKSPIKYDFGGKWQTIREWIKKIILN